MKKRDKIILSVIAGSLAMALSSSPLWWGVLFSPVTRQLTTASVVEEPQGGFRWELDGEVFRFKSLDLLFSFLHHT